MAALNSKASARFLITLASLVPTVLIAGKAFSLPAISLQSSQRIESESSVQFSENTAAKLQYFDSDSQQLAKVFLQENGPSFVRKIRPFVRENGPSFVRHAQADSPNVPYASSPASAVETFASLARMLNIG